ncbi:MAG: peptidase, partial [Nitratireductor sp.]|nr:peptidase [Nitratireductor sp.]
IVARALGIPVVGQVQNVLSLADTDNAIIADGLDGEVYVRPTEEIQSAYSEKVRFRAKRQEIYDKLRDEPAVSKDGVAVNLLMNAGLLMDLPNLERSGAKGIGLFRTELQFMVASHMPRPNEQENLYSAVLEAAGSLPVTFRTLDIGGDKVLPYMRHEQEENPALGWRAVRLSLDRPGLLRPQIRALLKAAANRELRVMIPMVSETREITAVRKLINREVELLTRFGHSVPRRLAVGAMIEVPSLLFQLDELMQAVDFVSVGSNDLFQFMFASDRGNPRIAKRFDPMSRPFLRALRRIVDAAARFDTPLTLCGEIAGKPISALALLGIGFRSISMSAVYIGPVKAMLIETDIARLEQALLPELDKPSGGQTMREFLTDYAAQNGIPY